ncbi:MAG TPA: glycosyltransferase [Thermoanaerobaculia bacterium]|nr:glycosyltransferase [Thermoanaerobaculia bacterium]
MTARAKVAIVGPVFPYRSGVAYCTTRLAEELGADVISFKRQYPTSLYPGGVSDIDNTLPQSKGEFILDLVNPLTWLRAGWRLRQYDDVIFVLYIWVWVLPTRVMMALLRRRTRVIVQCHNVGDKEPAWWKRLMTNLVLRRGNVLVAHARHEADEAWRRSRGRHVVKTFLPVHELGGAIPSRDEARKALAIDSQHVALFFGHMRPFKGLDIALRAWAELKSDVLLLAAGEAWWNLKEEYIALAKECGGHAAAPARAAMPRVTPPGHAAARRGVRFEFRYIPDSEIATYFSAADVVIAPYRAEAQSGVALTAFHFARPVIATRVGGLPEIIDGTNGMLIEPEDPHDLARAVDEFFTSRDRAAMEQRAAESARRYSWTEYAKVFGRLLR